MSCDLVNVDTQTKYHSSAKLNDVWVVTSIFPVANIPLEGHATRQREIADVFLLLHLIRLMLTRSPEKSPRLSILCKLDEYLTIIVS